MIDTSKYKDLIHWRLGRLPADIEKGIEEETQQFHLHANTGTDYARQLLAEEKKIDFKTKKQKWKPVRKDNHLLDCEILAAACADDEWTPSFSYFARRHKTKAEQPVKQPRKTIAKSNYLS